MGFLDNSGDIILDAVLTDTGRMRLAKGDGSFRITKFALGDDEINYSLYDKNNPNGNAYYDVNIMQTPIFEAFSNNIASLNSRLISISRTNLLYLPVLKINDKVTGGSNYAISQIVQNGYILAVDEDTVKYLTNNTCLYNGASISNKGILNGFQVTNGEVITIDQGIDNTAVPATTQGGLDGDLVETQYLVEIDNRFGSIVDKNGANPATAAYIDDDNMAAYYFSYDPNDEKYIKKNTDVGQVNQVIAGARGTTFSFRIKAALEVGTNDYLFYQLGTNITSRLTNPAPNNARSIITTVRITGLTTGYAIDVPVVLIKKIS